MSDYKYNPWPICKIPKELQRHELDKLTDLGYKFSDPREILEIFEEKIAMFTN